MQKQYSRIGQAALIVVLLLLSVTILYPVLHVLAVSFSNNNNVVCGEVGVLPIRPNLDAYRYMFRYNLLGSGFKNSLFVLMVGTGINLLMTMITAYPLARRSLMRNSDPAMRLSWATTPTSSGIMTAGSS